MEPGGGSGDGAFLFGKDGLVAFLVRLVIAPAHVVRQGEMAVPFQIDGFLPADDAVTVIGDFHYGSRSSADGEGAADLHPFPRLREAAPE